MPTPKQKQAQMKALHRLRHFHIVAHRKDGFGASALICYSAPAGNRPWVGDYVEARRQAIEIWSAHRASLVKLTIVPVSDTAAAIRNGAYEMLITDIF